MMWDIYDEKQCPFVIIIDEWDIISMMTGEKVSVNTGSFSNDMTTFHVKDDVLTLLIHLGYDFEEHKAFNIWTNRQLLLN